jgi:hypothetical protein
MLALSTMSPTVQGILYLVGVVLFVVAAALARPSPPIAAIAAGLAFTVFVWMWNAFAAA